jgi:hypothetical protein
MHKTEAGNVALGSGNGAAKCYQVPIVTDTRNQSCPCWMGPAKWIRLTSKTGLHLAATAARLRLAPCPLPTHARPIEERGAKESRIMDAA